MGATYNNSLTKVKGLLWVPWILVLWKKLKPLLCNRADAFEFLCLRFHAWSTSYKALASWKTEHWAALRIVKKTIFPGYSIRTARQCHFHSRRQCRLPPARSLRSFLQILLVLRRRRQLFPQEHRQLRRRRRRQRHLCSREAA